MHRSLFAIVIAALLVALASAKITEASPSLIPCDAYSQGDSSCSPRFSSLQYVQIRSGVSFVWLRRTPASSGEVIGTVSYSSKTILVITREPAVWDGYQNWWLVGSLANKQLSGWVEQVSLNEQGSSGDVGSVPDAPPHATWTTPFTGGIQGGILFVWVRTVSDSNGAILATLSRGNTFTVLDTAPVYDGRQWWWYVQTGTIQGYIEQASINVLAAAPAPTLVPTPTVDPSGVFSAPPTVTFGCSQTTIAVHGPKVTTPSAPFMRSQIVNTDNNTVLAVQDVPLPDNPPYVITLTYPTQPNRAYFGIAMFLWNGSSEVGSAVAYYSGQCNSGEPTPVPTVDPNGTYNAPPTVTFGCSQTTIAVHGPQQTAALAPFMRSQIVNTDNNTVLAVQDVSLPDNPPYVITLTYPTQSAGIRLNAAMFLWDGTSVVGSAATFSGSCQ